jgi:DNA-binding XRE family transcriptional regulator
MPPSGSNDYTSAIKLFHKKDCGPSLLTSPTYLPMPARAPIAGYVCKTARELLGKTQAWLWTAAKVSRKTINDFENGTIEPKIELNNRLRRALEEAGASFVSGDDVVGVVVFTRPTSKKVA